MYEIPIVLLTDVCYYAVYLIVCMCSNKLMCYIFAPLKAITSIGQSVNVNLKMTI
jgi:hypothetical protein